MDLMIITYSLYLLFSVLMTLLVGRILHRNGRPFLLDIYGSDELMADSVNNLLLAGFYLINFGFVMLSLTEYSTVVSGRDLFELLSTKLGGVALALGAMHFMNIIVLFKIRRKGSPKNVTV